MTAKSQTDLKALIVSGGVGRRNDIHDIIDSIPILNSDPALGIEFGDGTDRDLQILFDLATDRIIQWKNSNSRFEISTNTHISGTLEVSGATTLSSSLTANGNVDINGTLSVSGATTLTGAVEINNTLQVSGQLTALSQSLVNASNALLAFNASDGTFRAQTQYIDGSDLYRLNIVDNASTGKRRIEINGESAVTEMGLGFDSTAAPVAGIMLNVAEAVARNANSPAQITSDQNDYDFGRTSNARLSTDASRTITGLANGTDGRILYLANVGSFDLVLANQNASSTAANRIITGTGANVTLVADDTAILNYDSTTSRWRIFNTH